MSSSNTNHQICLPLLLDPSLTDQQSLICICGHYINCHSDGLSGYSPCEEDEGFCGCITPEVDIGETVRQTFFLKSDGKIMVDSFHSTYDFSRYTYISNGGGFPALIESSLIPISSKINPENYKSYVVSRHEIKGESIRKL